MSIFSARRKRRKSTNSFTLQDEKSGKSLFGFSYGSTGFVQLAEKDGGRWSGGIIETTDDGNRYRFNNEAGESMTGASSDGSIVLRDSKGRIFKGVVS